MRRSLRITTALALAALAAGVATAFSLSAEPQRGETATALVRFDRYEGTLGTGLDAAQNVGEEVMIAKAVGRELGLRPRTVQSSVRVSAEPATGVVAISATRPTAEQARRLAGAFVLEFIGSRRPLLRDQARESRRYVRFLLAEGREGGISDARRRILREEEALLTDFLGRLEANQAPAVAQEAQIRAAPTSGAGLLSGLLAAVGGLALALAVMWLAGSRGEGGPSAISRSEPAKNPAEGPRTDLGEPAQARAPSLAEHTSRSEK